MNTKTNYPHLYEPVKLGRLQLKNHIMTPPMLCCLATARGEVTRDLLLYTGHLAKCGAGLVIIGESNIDADRSYDHVGALNLGSDLAIPGLAQIAEEVHRYGAKISIEINHSGACAEELLLEQGKHGLSPSPLPDYIHPQYKGKTVEILDRTMMDKIKENYLDAVGRLVKAGFDMVTFHCAHGWLMGQFLSPSFNKRTDEYGGSVENRMRYPLEILKAIYDEYHDEILIDMRISGSARVPEEISPQENDFENVLTFVKAAEPYLDMVNISAGFIPYLPSLDYMIQPYLLPHLTNVEFAERLKKEVEIPVAVAGSITTLDEAESVLINKKADIVGMARAGLADMECFVKGEQGREEEIRPCLRCVRCASRIEPPAYKGIHCAVNPLVGREAEYGNLPAAREKKKIMIIGGGPAGMEACQRCRERGHEVVLYEAADKLGGMLHVASALPFKEDMRRYTNWMIKQTEKSGAVIHLNTKATAEVIQKENPDVVLVGIGSKPFWPSISVEERQKFVWAGEADMGMKPLGDRIVIAGAGLTGTETAIGLAQKGKKVTVIDMIPEDAFLKGNAGTATLAICKLIQQLDIQFIFQSKLVEIIDKGVVYADKDGKMHELECDTVVNALGMKYDREEVDRLRNVIPESYVIGDCSGKQMTIENAVLDAFTVSMNI